MNHQAGIPQGAHGAADDVALRQAAAAIDGQRPDVAERIARDVLNRNSDHAEALHILGVALLAQKRAGEAVPPLEQVARNRSDPIIEAHLGKALREAGRAAEALTWLQRATAHEPPFAPAFHELGVLHASMFRFDDAEIALKRGLDASPTEVEMIVELGGVYICRAEPDRAKTAFAQALAQMPDHPRALHGFGTALLYEGDFEGAAQRFRQVLARHPGHARARLDLGHCLLELGRWDEAVACLRGMAQAAPQFYGRVLKAFVSAGHGRLWLRPSAAAEFINAGTAGAGTAPTAGQRSR